MTFLRLTTRYLVQLLTRRLDMTRSRWLLVAANKIAMCDSPLIFIYIDLNIIFWTYSRLLQIDSAAATETHF
jgi:hypothetical protein